MQAAPPTPEAERETPITGGSAARTGWGVRGLGMGQETRRGQEGAGVTGVTWRLQGPRWAIGAACKDLEAVCRRWWGARVGLGDGGKYEQSRQFGD